MIFHRIALVLLLLTTATHAAERTVRVAAVHFEPIEGDVKGNVSRLVQLTREAALKGAKLIVHTEMATAGYSFFSREQLSKVAEPIPGPSTRALGAVAREFGVYVAFGLPEYDKATNLYFNSVALIGPRGEVVGTYRKRNNLLEASYNSEVWSSVPTYDTPFGRIAIVICADMFYSAFPRLAALAGASILVAPANVGISTDFMKVRTWENDLSMIVANRFGHGGKGSKPMYFNQDSFAIPSPFAYDFDDTRTAIVSNKQEILADVTEKRVQIAYADLPIRKSRLLPVVRRPSLYPLLAQDTLEPYTFTQFGLPAPTVFAAAAVDPGKQVDTWAEGLNAAKKALAVAKEKGMSLRLVVFPSNYFARTDVGGIDGFRTFATENNVDIVIQFATDAAPQSLMIASNGENYSYSRTHRLRQEKIPDDKLSSHYWVVDRDYARVALLHDVDLMAPETSLIMEKLGVDVVALNADTSVPAAQAIWASRTADYYNIVVANKQGKEGIYLGGYPPGPQAVEDEGLALTQIDTRFVRSKKVPRFLDFKRLLEPCGAANC
jgi:predicted amidohydrolase